MSIFHLMDDMDEALQEGHRKLIEKIKQEEEQSRPLPAVHLVTYGGTDREVVAVYSTRKAAEEYASKENEDAGYTEESWIRYSVESWDVSK